MTNAGASRDQAYALRRRRLRGAASTICSGSVTWRLTTAPPNKIANTGILLIIWPYVSYFLLVFIVTTMWFWTLAVPFPRSPLGSEHHLPTAHTCALATVGHEIQRATPKNKIQKTEAIIFCRFFILFFRFEFVVGSWIILQYQQTIVGCFFCLFQEVSPGNWFSPVVQWFGTCNGWGVNKLVLPLGFGDCPAMEHLRSPPCFLGSFLGDHRNILQNHHFFFGEFLVATSPPQGLCIVFFFGENTLLQC